MKELGTLARPVVAQDSTWEQIQRAKVRTGLGVGAIIGAVRAGRLQLGRSPRTEGYDGFLVRRDEVDRMAPSQSTPTSQDLIAAARFGRSIGLRDGGRFLALVEAGHTPARLETHPRTNVERFYMSTNDIAAFHRRFVTLTTLAGERGTHRNTVAAQLKAAGVRPFAPDGVDFGQIWLREEAKAALE